MLLAEMLYGYAYPPALQAIRFESLFDRESIESRGIVRQAEMMSRRIFAVSVSSIMQCGGKILRGCPQILRMHSDEPAFLRLSSKFHIAALCIGVFDGISIWII